MMSTVGSILTSTSINKLERGFIGNYRVVSVLKEGDGIRVVLAIYFKSLWFKRCVIKSFAGINVVSDKSHSIRKDYCGSLKYILS